VTGVARILPAAVLAVLLGAPPRAAGLDFAVDYASFRGPLPDSTTVELYHSIPYDQLHYRDVADTLIAVYRVRVDLRNLETGTTLSHSLFEPAVIPKSAEPARRRLSIGNSFSVNLVPGRYVLEFEVSDTAGSGRRTETLLVRDLSGRPDISDPIIGSSVLRDSFGTTSVVPQASRRFGAGGLYEMYVFVEGYDFAAPDDASDTLYHDLSILIRGDSGQVVRILPDDRRRRFGARFSEIFGLTTRGLRPGNYELEVRLRDVATATTALTRKRFLVAGEPSIASVPGRGRVDTLLLSAGQRAAFHDLRYAATEREQKELERLNPDGRAEYLQRFWAMRDFPGYLLRLAAVDARFGWGRILGRDTDQGRVYLRNGEPDEIEAHTMIEHARPHEHWRYYNLGFHYIFVDVRGDGRLRLVYSSDQDFRNDPKWKDLVDPLELDNLR
jgi:GWxTD domain-containing protein